MAIGRTNAGVGGGSSSGYPEFGYTGEYSMIDDGGGNWRIRLLTSGTLTFQKLKSAKNGIDIFLVGGGGGGANGKYGESYGCGGGGGYTRTTKRIAVYQETAYAIAIGAGGAIGGDGGQTTAFGLTANGGKPGNLGSGGSGGSGGGRALTGGGGSNGGNGGNSGGIGQGTSTKEFGEDSGDLYAGGGGSGTSNAQTNPGGSGGGGDGAVNYKLTAKSGIENTGGGGGGGGAADYVHCSGAPGGSGIVVIRNARG